MPGFGGARHHLEHFSEKEEHTNAAVGLGAGWALNSIPQQNQQGKYTNQARKNIEAVG